MGHLPPTAHDGSLTLRGALRSRGAALRCLVLVLAFALRLVGSRASQGHGYEYWLEMADHVRAGEGLHRTMPWGQGERWAIRTPGYPLLLTGLGWLPGPMLTKVAILGALAGTDP